MDTTSTQSQATTQPDVSPVDSTWLGLNFAWELGYTIAIPAVIFGIGGAYLDKYMHTSPLCMLSGFVFAFLISTISITRKIREILNQMPKVLPKKPDPVKKEISESDEFHEFFRPKS